MRLHGTTVWKKLTKSITSHMPGWKKGGCGERESAGQGQGSIKTTSPTVSVSVSFTELRESMLAN